MKIVLLLLFFCGACSSRNGVQTILGSTMGTTYSVKYVGSSDLKEKLMIEIEKQLERVNQSMSTYRPDSELSQINKNHSSEWLPLSSELDQVIICALELSKMSKGAYDITLGPVVNLWGFGPQGERKIPSNGKIAKALNRSGYDKLSYRKGKIKKGHPELYLDLSSIAKGYGVDLVAETLQQEGISNFLVEIGGELRAQGSKPSGAWRVAIQTPGKDNQAFQYVLNLSGQSVATSGDYRNYFTENGQKYSHTIDAKTGRPVQNDVASVTVVSDKSCMLADGYATMLLALPRQEAISISEKYLLASYIIWRDKEKFQIYKSSRFKELFGD